MSDVTTIGQALSALRSGLAGTTNAGGGGSAAGLSSLIDSLRTGGTAHAGGFGAAVTAPSSPSPHFDTLHRLSDLMNPQASPGDGLGAGRTELIAQAFNPATGRYEFSGDRDVDAVLIGSRWTITNLTFSFPTDGSFYTGYSGTDNEAAGFIQFNAQQQAAARYALGLISSYTNLTFTEVTETATTHARIRFGQSSDASVPSAQAHFPSSSVKAGDVWFGTSGQPFYTTPALGNWGQATMMHELGHAMGLKHGHSDYTNEDLVGVLDAPPGGGIRPGSVQLSGERDGQDWSLMTYRADPTAVGSSPTDAGGFEGEGFNQPQTYMQQDIAALQYLYGANFSTNAGNTTYTWDPATGRESINGVAQGTPTSNKILMTIWDGNGNDTYDLSNYTTALDIDLNPGAFSTFSAAQLVNHQAKSGGTATAEGNVANALLYQGDLRSLIENAKGGSNADRILGNQTGNVLTGNAGADTLIGGAGNDSLNGGNDNDLLYGDARPGGSPGVGTAGNGQVNKAVGAGNFTVQNALSLDGHFNLAADPNILDSTTAPHVTISGQGDGNYDFYKVTVAAGTTLRIDVDNSTGFLDSYIELYTSAGVLLAKNDDSLISAGAGGSTAVQDSLITYTVQQAGTYIIAIGNFGGEGFPAIEVFLGQNYQINVSAYGPDELGGGTAGDDTLNGGAGTDTMIGGAGNDTYVYTAGDIIQEDAAGGTDTVQSSATFSLVSLPNVENLTLTGGAASAGTGNAAANVITGNGAANTLSGAGGNDTLRGGGGADTMDGGANTDVADYRDKTAAVSVTLDAATEVGVTVGGVAEDRIRNIEGVFGGTAGDTLTGDLRNNTLSGFGGNDTLAGGAGKDTLDGGDGADTADYADQTLAVVVTLNGAAAAAVTLGGTADDTLLNIENVIGGSAGDSLTGDTLANALTGNQGDDLLRGGGGNDTLDGGTGADTMVGGGGDDVYRVDSGADQTSESSAAGGTDTVYSSVSRTLGINLENLRLEGTLNLKGNGNELANQIFGNDGSNVLQGLDGNDTLSGGLGEDELRGGTGNDSMTGGDGNDRYFVDSANDKTIESNANLATGGIDTVFSTVNRTLGANIEILRLQGTADLNGNGNELNNKLFGTTGANLLKGLAGNDTIDGKDGNDTLEGGDGNDTLTGGGGADVFRFAASNAGVDTITDFSRNFDKFDLGGGTFSALSIAPNGDAVLTHAGGAIRVQHPPSLTLAQWNALVLPSGARADIAMAADPGGYHPLAHGDFVSGHHGDWLFA